MTLYRQVLMLLLLITLVSLAGVMALNLKSNSNYLEQQLRSGTDASFTSLGMRLAPLLDPLDRSSAESTVNAAFDGTLLLRVDVELFSDDSHITREREPISAGVPKWFVSLFEIDPIITQAPITQGWREVALLTVEGHPGTFHTQLWTLAIRLTLIYGFIFVCLAVFSSIALRWLIKPLRQIEEQAEAITQRDFDKRIPVPRTRELRRVVEVFNRLTDVLKARFLENARQLDDMREKLLIDADSGLKNRRAFLDLHATYREEGQAGILLLLRASHGDIIRKQYGYHVWRSVVEQLSEVIQRSLTTGDASEVPAIGRLSSQEFAVLLKSNTVSDPAKTLKQICKASADLHPTKDDELTLECIGVGCSFLPEQTTGQILTRLDETLRMCSGSGQSSVWLEEQSNQHTLRTAEQWVGLLRDRLKQGALQLRWQPVLSRQGDVLQQEVFASVLDEKDQALHAGIFVPVIEQFDLGAMLDDAVLKAVIAASDTESTDGKVSINLSLSSMRDTRFVGHLAALDKAYKERIQFEVSELNLNRDLETVAGFANVLRKLGFTFGIDQVGATDRSLNYLRELRPAYVKVAPGICRADDDALSLLTSIGNTVTNLDIPFYATAVETQEQADALWPSGITGIQGYLTGG